MGDGGGPAGMAETSHTAKPTLRPLSDFVTEDPNVYSETEIREILDTIDCGNRTSQSTHSQSAQHSHHHGGLKPIVKAYGLVGYIRFLVSVYWRIASKLHCYPVLPHKSLLEGYILHHTYHQESQGG